MAVFSFMVNKETDMNQIDYYRRPTGHTPPPKPEHKEKAPSRVGHWAYSILFAGPVFGLYCGAFVYAFTGGHVPILFAAVPIAIGVAAHFIKEGI